MRTSTVASVFTVLALTASVACAASERAPAPRPFEWKRSTPEAQGVDSEMLLRAIRRIRDEDLEIRSLILIRNDHVILELYVHPYHRNSIHNVKSVSKSILSALVGIALREGTLKSTDQRVREFFPDYFPDDDTDARNRITLKHLLTMTSGLDLDENGPKMAAVFRSEDWIKTTFEAGMAAPPGERFVYSTPLTHTMVGILTEAGGRPLLEFADEHLFGPLDFGALQWRRGPKGYYFGGAELFLRTRDMAKFGMLYQHDGEFAGRQIVPREWVEESTSNQLPEDSMTRYGYWWWLDPGGGGFRARGWGGQGISVWKDLGMIAAGTSGDHSAPDRMFRDFDPSALSDGPLDPNPAAVAELERLTRELEQPSPIAVPELPETASRVSGRTYRLEENPRGFEEFTFRFEPGSATATIVSSARGATYESEIGLDGVYRLSDIGTEGPMPEGNEIALRGRWTGADEFTLDAHRVGDPIHGTQVFTFAGDRLDVGFEIRPTGDRFTLSGRRLRIGTPAE